MSKVSLLKTNQLIDVQRTTGLAPVIGYEPWALRTIESVKQSLVDGQPVLIRIHSALSYPAENDRCTAKLDMESHAVLIVGYDDYRQEFDVIDPWRTDWKGSKGGISTIKYEILPIVCVNATAEKTTRTSTIQKHIIICSDDSNNTSVNAEFGFYIPKGYIIDEKQSKFTEFDVTVSYTLGESTFTYRDIIRGEWWVGETAKMTIPIGKNISEQVDLHFSVSAKLVGERPYHYEDTINFEFDEVINKSNRYQDNFIPEVKSKRAVI
ncbi:C39 family peptidase [Aerococcaceae bacterium NML191219]|nr:C39 family peptidase [Aerococcaceae bacterium NML191219]